MSQLFLDLDGVLADTAGFYQFLFATPITWTPTDFPNINRCKNFYLEQPIAADAMMLWEGSKILGFSPIILTGIPYSVPDVHNQKVAWVEKHFGPTAPVITCASRDKCNHGEPGDILVDDRIKFSHLWLEMGGTFIHHTSAQDSLQQLQRLVARRKLAALY